LILTLGLLGFVPATFDVHAQSAVSVTGRTVAIVAHPGGTFEEQGGGWVEKDAAGQVSFRFEETGRDGWSVYLLDRSRNVRLQLDLHRKQVLYAAGDETMRPLYPITEAGADPVSPPGPPAPGRATGWDVAHVVHARGMFEKQGREWVEKDSAGQVSFRFEETGRDDESVYLLDRSRNVRLQLDLRREQVLYAAGDDPMRPLYKIRSASTNPASRNREQGNAHGRASVPGPRTLRVTNESNAPVWVVAIVGDGQQEGIEAIDPGQSTRLQTEPGQVLAFADAEGSGWVGEQYEVSAAAQQDIAVPYFRRAAPGQQKQSHGERQRQTAVATPSQRPSAPNPVKLTPAQVKSISEELIKSIVKAQVDEQNRPEACWRDSYGRGVGKIPDCGPSQTKSGLLCYPKCGSDRRARSGTTYKNVAGVCWQQCPSGFRDDGVFCRKNRTEYGRGAGYGVIPFKEWDDSGAFKRCEKDHGRGQCEKHGLVVYPKCDPGYTNVGCCICKLKDDQCRRAGLDSGSVLALGSCKKHSFVVLPEKGGCSGNRENDAGLCYPRCQPNYKGVGPVCWATCPPHMPVNCGASCAKSKAACAMTITDQASAPIMAAGNAALTVATLGTATGASAAAKAGATASKVAAKAAARAAAKATLKASVKTALKNRIKYYSKELAKDLAIDAAIGGVLSPAIWAGMSEKNKADSKAAIGDEVRKQLERELSDPDSIDAIVEATMKGVEEQSPAAAFPWESLDPTGIAEIVVAYNMPLCSNVPR
jgi:hypothetical protein